MFQTASLFSIEVDYYKFGTCEMAGGSYFCGDHSCNTFKYVGEKVNGVGGKTVYEQPAYGSAVKTASGSGDNVQLTGSTRMYDPLGGQPSVGQLGLYMGGSGNEHGSRDDTNGIANNPAIVTNSHTQLDHSGYALHGDAGTRSYHLYDGMKASTAAVFAATGVDQYHTTKHWHMTETLVAGSCKSKCDVDVSCRAFQENRWQQMHVQQKCTTFHFGAWVSETNLIANLTPDVPWDFYEKYANAKNPTWLHSPINTAYSPTTSGAGSAKYAGFQSQGRRLDGVF